MIEVKRDWGILAITSKSHSIKKKSGKKINIAAKFYVFYYLLCLLQNESPASKPASENGLKEPNGGVSPQRPAAAIPIQPAPADWVRRERQGKKGEFRYF